MQSLLLNKRWQPVAILRRVWSFKLQLQICICPICYALRFKCRRGARQLIYNWRQLIDLPLVNLWSIASLSKAGESHMKRVGKNAGVRGKSDIYGICVNHHRKQSIVYTHIYAFQYVKAMTEWDLYQLTLRLCALKPCFLHPLRPCSYSYYAIWLKYKD